MSYSKNKIIIESAEIVEWDGGPLCDLDGSEYYDGEDALIQKFIYDIWPGEDITPPRYFYPCETIHLAEAVEAWRIAEGICQALRFEFDREDEWLDLDEFGLKKHIENWLQNHSIFLFEEDRSKIVDLTNFWKEALEEVGNE